MNRFIGILFFISWFITVVFGYIGIFNIIDNFYLANIIGFGFWIINGYIHIKAYSNIIDDYNKKQP